MKNVILFLFAVLPTILWSQPQEISVSTTKEFLDALGSNRTILVQKGVFALSDHTESESENYFFEEHFNGKELIVQGVNNLTIKGVGNLESHFITKPTYGKVIVFQDCVGIKIENLKAGHGEQKGECVGGVFSFKRCSAITINNCWMYGSGTEGITAEDCKEITIQNSSISGCTYSICTFMNCATVLFQNCRMFDNVEFEMVNLSNCKSVVFRDCKFNKNRAGESDGGYCFFGISSSKKVLLDHCTILDNRADYLCNNQKMLKLIACTSPKSQWTKGLFEE